MSFNVIVNGVHIPDEKVIAVHGMKEFVSPAVVANKLNMIKPQVVEVRRRLREGLADIIDGKDSAIAKKKPASNKVSDKKQGHKPAIAEGNPVSIDKILAVIAASPSRMHPKDVSISMGFKGNGPRHEMVKEALKSMRESGLLERKNPGTYSPTMLGIDKLGDTHLAHKNALARAKKHKTESAPAEEVSEQSSESLSVAFTGSEQAIESLYEARISPCPEAVINFDCQAVPVESYKNPASIFYNWDQSQPSEVDKELSDIDELFKKQALVRLAEQTELLEKIHSLAGKLADEIKQSIAQISAFNQSEE